MLLFSMAALGATRLNTCSFVVVVFVDRLAIYIFLADFREKSRIVKKVDIEKGYRIGH